MAAACECRALCLAAAAGIAAFYTDLSSMAFAVIVVSAVHSFAVNRACGGGFSCYITIRIPFAFLEAVAAGFFCTFCRVSAYYDTIQVTIEIFVVCTCLYGTS